MTDQSNDVLNRDLLSDPKAIDFHRRTLVGVVAQEPRWPLAGTDDSAHQRNSRQRRRLQKQLDASVDIGPAPMFALSGFSGGKELDWDWDWD